jgi:hypothetical protein
MSITLANLRTQARYRANMENSLFITDAELNGYINSSIAELHDLMIGAYDSEYSVTYSDTTTTTTTDYSLPATFYKLKGVDYGTTNDFYALKPFNFNERNKDKALSFHSLGEPNIRYRIVGSQLKLSAAPDAGKTLRIWYVPVATVLSADADTLDDLNQYYEYVVVDAAIKMLHKEESDVTILAAYKMDLRKRIETMAQNRDASASPSITDIYNDRFE